MPWSDATRSRTALPWNPLESAHATEHPQRLDCPHALPGQCAGSVRAEDAAERPATPAEDSAKDTSEGPATADARPRRRGPGNQIGRAEDLPGAATAGRKTAVPVGDAGRGVRRAGQG